MNNGIIKDILDMDVNVKFINIDYTPKPIAGKMYAYLRSLRRIPYKMNRLQSLRFIKGKQGI